MGWIYHRAPLYPVWVSGRVTPEGAESNGGSMTMGYKYESGNVVLTMTHDDYQRLILCLGMAAGQQTGDGRNFRAALALADRLSAGNPHWTPYDIPETE